MISGQISLPAKARPSPKINIATPAYKSEYNSPYVRSLYSLLTAAPSLGLRFSFSEIDYSDIVVSRNYLASNFYFNKPDCDYLLFIDADMGFPHQLIAEMVALREPLVGVVYPRRSLDLERLHAGGDLPFRKAYVKACSLIGDPGDPHPRNPAFRRVNNCGTGILLIARSCLATMLQRCPQILDPIRYKKFPFNTPFESFMTPFDKLRLEDRELSEDLSFCHRWRQHCDGVIYANISHDIEHVGQITIRTCQADSL